MLVADDVAASAQARERGLVEVERAGREWIYRLNRRRLRVASEWLGWFEAAPPARAKKT